ncbi:MAG: DOPA 4,5-dioxygenase family protein [Burkholderiales bacterium]
MSTAPITITGYHAHIYYDPTTRETAARVREGLGARFDVRLGRWHDKPVGPHPISMYQVAFAVAEFPRVVPWLMVHREGLDVLVHPETGDDVIDHTDHAMWLGTKIDLDIDALRRG